MVALNEIGKPVDWFFAYKVPLLHGGVGGDSATGYEYVYFDSEAKAPEKSQYRLDLGAGAVHATLGQLGKNPGLGYILYNDERPDGKPDDNAKGHTKGVLAWDTVSNTGFWLIHSWPLFPNLQSSDAPTPIYGQTFLCLSLSFDELNKVAAVMLSNHEPQVYDSWCPPETLNCPIAVLASATTFTHEHPVLTVTDITTLGGVTMKLIAKNREWNDDFWNDGVGPSLGCDLAVETWIRGPIAPSMDADGLHRTLDVKFINFTPCGIHWAWPETNDHAKWAISSDPSQPWVCVGDINRMISQRKRGGGCVAFQNLGLWSALSKTDIISAPAGMTRSQAHSHIKSTHKVA